MEQPDWLAVFTSVCARGQITLEWETPEPWIQAELYAELKRLAPSSGWEPLHTEVPYVTAYPVRLPAQANRDWRRAGAVKWVDLCLHSQKANTWCWFELKVRHAGKAERLKVATAQAHAAFAKDVVALMGFDAEATASTWIQPDKYTITYWFPDILVPRAERVRTGRHCFAAALLLLGTEPEQGIWDDHEVRAEVAHWLSYRRDHSVYCGQIYDTQFGFSLEPVADEDSLLICSWAQGN